MKKQIKLSEIEKFTDDELKRFIFCYGDGQGDTYLRTLDQMVNEDNSIVDMITSLYDEYGYNMVNVAWIENNRMVEVNIIWDNVHLA